MKVKKTYRLEEETISELEKYAKKKGMSATAAIEFAIQKMVQLYGNEPDGGQTAVTELALIAQLEAKDEQIAALLEQLAAAQEVSQAVAETAKAAQALHAASVGELAPSGGASGRWARLKAAWRG